MTQDKIVMKFKLKRKKGKQQNVGKQRGIRREKTDGDENDTG